MKDLRQRVDRRAAHKGLLATGAGATAIVGAPTARAGSHRQPSTERETGFVVDVACLADTFRFIPAPDPSSPPDSPLWGAPFLVEGLIFDGGALQEKAGFDPRSDIDQAIGTWLCRGSVLIRSDRGHPHGATTQHYLFPRLSGSPTFPADQLFSEGLEGADEEKWDAPRAVIGGTGQWTGARGTVIQTQIGTNATTSGAGVVIPAGPNFRFSFELELKSGLH